MGFLTLFLILCFVTDNAFAESHNIYEFNQDFLIEIYIPEKPFVYMDSVESSEGDILSIGQLSNMAFVTYNTGAHMISKYKSQNNVQLQIEIVHPKCFGTIGAKYKAYTLLPYGCKISFVYNETGYDCTSQGCVISKEDFML